MSEVTLGKRGARLEESEDLPSGKRLSIDIAAAAARAAEISKQIRGIVSLLSSFLSTLFLLCLFADCSCFVSFKLCARC